MFACLSIFEYPFGCPRTHNVIYHMLDNACTNHRALSTHCLPTLVKGAPNEVYEPYSNCLYRCIPCVRISPPFAMTIKSVCALALLSQIYTHFRVYIKATDILTAEYQDFAWVCTWYNGLLEWFGRKYHAESRIAGRCGLVSL